jgi:CubicO group peptidase (beta-lactamase class C family)
MSHSAGFRGATWPWGGDQPWHPHEPAQWEQIVAMLPYTQILFPPGSRFSYSNPGIVFLGRVIEVITGDDYEVYADKNVFKPLGMHRTYFDTAPFHLRADLSMSYYRRGGAGGTLDPARPDVDTGITVSNGGMNAPLDDMARILDFLLGNPSRQADATACSTGDRSKRCSSRWSPSRTTHAVRDGPAFFRERRPRSRPHRPQRHSERFHEPHHYVHPPSASPTWSPSTRP